MCNISNLICESMQYPLTVDKTSAPKPQFHGFLYKTLPTLLLLMMSVHNSSLILHYLKYVTFISDDLLSHNKFFHACAYQ